MAVCTFSSVSRKSPLVEWNHDPRAREADAGYRIAFGISRFSSASRSIITVRALAERMSSSSEKSAKRLRKVALQFCRARSDESQVSLRMPVDQRGCEFNVAGFGLLQLEQSLADVLVVNCRRRADLSYVGELGLNAV